MEGGSMSPGLLRGIGIGMFVIAFIIIVLSHNASFKKTDYAIGTGMLIELSSRLATTYHYDGVPETLDGLLQKSDQKDPWGTRFRYAPCNGYYLLWSAGQNKKFESLGSHEDDVLVFAGRIETSWTKDSIIDLLDESNHAALAQLMFVDDDPALKRAASRWSVANNYNLDINYQVK